MKTFRIKPHHMIFHEKVRQACKSCKHYGKKATCPPYAESIDYYKKLFESYTHCVICYKEFKADQTNWQEVSRQSSLELHKFLLKRRQDLIDSGHYFYAIFGAGSCKLCKECTIPCKNPGQSIMPLEGTGLDVVATMKSRIDIKFPVKGTFYRVGAIFYD